MRGTYTTRRGAAMNSSSWGRNRNFVRHSSGKTIGTGSLAVMLGMIVLMFGLIYVTQGTKATAYDYNISNVETEISELESKKEDLSVEQARLTSIAASENSKVAANMESGEVSGYANE